jgi:hypothetical protein
MFPTILTWRWGGLAAAFVLVAALVIPGFSATPARGHARGLRQLRVGRYSVRGGLQHHPGAVRGL